MERPAGWYPDPDGGSEPRWWDGRDWSFPPPGFDPPPSAEVVPGHASPPGASSGLHDATTASEPTAAYDDPTTAFEPVRDWEAVTHPEPVRGFEPSSATRVGGELPVARPQTSASRTDTREWWERRRVLVPAVGVVALILGLLIGRAGGDGAELEAARAAANNAEIERDEVQRELDRVNGELSELQADFDGAVAELDAQISGLEDARDAAMAAVRAELEDERAQVLAAAEEERAAMLAAAEEEAEELLAEAEQQLAELEERSAELEALAAELEEREAALAEAEQRQAATTFGNGVHVVGQDVEPGTYRTDGGSNCYWARLSGLGGDHGDVIADGIPDGPATVEIRASDAGFESSGCATWTRTR